MAGLLALLALSCDAYDEHLLTMRREHYQAFSGGPVPAAIGGTSAELPAAAGAAAGEGAAGSAGTNQQPAAAGAAPIAGAAPVAAGAGGSGAAGSAPTGGGTNESPRCGDGIVQSNETCEANSAKPCPSAADCDDHDACTRDLLSGSAASCTAACKHETVSEAKPGDGCCPAGANATTDSDCSAKCGNGVREGAEECDGSTGCDASCKQTLNPEQLQCVSKLVETACEQCQCEKCATEMLACRASGNATRDAACTAVEVCATQAHCAGDACYCGTAGLLTCELLANGPCEAEVERAAGTGLALEIRDQYQDPATALGRAGALGECRRKNCATQCK
ncbi:MAG TPA: hypothetical protein VJR89_04910 [Polyangiales bacterium]|nr:hypothetical protein [Polyangiales bacterium]